MKNKFIIVAIMAGLAVFKITAAQISEPKLIVTWQSQNYQPADYKGKNLPTLNSPVIAAVELIDNGKLINLSSAKITWFQNGNLIVNGIGLKRIAFNANDLIGNRLLLEADVVYKKRELQSAAIIPIVEPKAVIAAPHVFNQEIRTGTYNFKVMPFFFNIKRLSELTFNWSVNEQQETAGQNPDVLSLEIASEDPDPVPLNLTATISNINNIIEAARDELRLILIP